MRFPPAFIERIRSHFLISEVVGKRMPIKKHGREFQGLCPFHNEKSPSFTVNDEKGFYHCFGCGAHGDVIEFVRKFERINYVDTIEALAREAGIVIPAVSAEDSRKAETTKTLYDVMEAACTWFEKQLSNTAGAIAHDYVEKRGLKPDTLRIFRIGYATGERTGLHQHLLKAGYAKELQLEAGLIISPDQGQPYDRFRGRVMFPIRNSAGKVIAFGGRLLPGVTTNKSIPKYLNSPETPLFRKGEGLYNIDLAKKVAREKDRVVVMEGYMDVVSAWQAGIHYAVAALGTAVTESHLRLLWQLTKEPIFCLDGDEAGKRAMSRATEVALPLLKPTFSLRFASLPKGEDPDTYIQKNGPGSFEKILSVSRRLLESLWDEHKQKYNLKIPGELAGLEIACKQFLEKITDLTVRKDYNTHINSHLRRERDTIWKSNRTTAKTQRPRALQVEQLAVQHYSIALDTLVQRLLTIVLKFPELLYKSKIEETLSHLDIRSNRLDNLRNALISACTDVNIDDRSVFIAYLEKQTHSALLDDSLKLPYNDTLDIKDALLLWNETVNVYEVAHLEFELKELQESVGQTMDESVYHRMVELQQSLRKAQSVRTFAPVETDFS